MIERSGRLSFAAVAFPTERPNKHLELTAARDIASRRGRPYCKAGTVRAAWQLRGCNSNAVRYPAMLGTSGHRHRRGKRELR